MKTKPFKKIPLIENTQIDLVSKKSNKIKLLENIEIHKNQPIVLKDSKS
jgi:hypothetical protein